MVLVIYSYVSGRYYYNLNVLCFMLDCVFDYYNFVVMLSYFMNVKGMFIVIYLSVDNVINQYNIFGYCYFLDGIQVFLIKLVIYCSFFLGVNFLLMEFNKDEL